MAEFDPKAFAKEVLKDIQKAGKPALKEAFEDGKDAKKALDRYEKAVEDTFAALKVETDPVKITALQHDLEKVLPARKAAIISAAVTELSGDVMAFLETALDIAIKAAVVAAKAFVGKVV